MPRHISPLDYAFAIGKIRVLEKFLIRQEVFFEAAELDFDAAVSRLSEAGGYGDAFAQARTGRQLDAALGAESRRLARVVGELLTEEGLTRLIGMDTAEEAARLSKELHSEFLRDYLSHLVDMHNCKVFLRLRLLKEPVETLERSLCRGGFIDVQDLKKTYGQDLAVFIRLLGCVRKRDTSVDYASFLASAVRSVEEDRSFVMLEKAAADFLIRLLAPAKYMSFGPEPVAAYFLAKTNEINLVRLVLLAQFAGAPRELVKQRLNNVYA